MHGRFTRLVTWLAAAYLSLCLLSLLILALSYVYKPHVPKFALEGGVSLYDSPSQMLLVMTGYDSTWIAESPAGYVFVHKYALAYEICRKRGLNYSAEICASALWADQVIRDLPKSRLTLMTLAAYKAYPAAAFFLMPIMYITYLIELSLPYRTKCAILYYGIVNYGPYVNEFPEWKHLSLSSWLKLCELFRNYTIEPWDNYEGDIIVGATFLMLSPWSSSILPA